MREASRVQVCWINHCRRVACHYETTPIAHEGLVCLSQIALLLSRLDRSQLFDTYWLPSAAL